jgi:hypothetical protein
MAADDEFLGMERLYFDRRRSEISTNLFESGAAIQIATSRYKSIPPKRVTLGTVFWDSVCAPVLQSVPLAGHDITLLGMARLEDRGVPSVPSLETQAVYCAGHISPTGRLYPLEHVPEHAARQLYAAALSLVMDRDEGVLPHLSDDLLAIKSVQRPQ